jgi:hypothetical protein
MRLSSKLSTLRRIFASVPFDIKTSEAVCSFAVHAAKYQADGRITYSLRRSLRLYDKFRLTECCGAYEVELKPK